MSKSVIDKDGLWPQEGEQGLKDWDKAAAQPGLDAAEQGSAPQQIARKSQIPGYVEGGTKRSEFDSRSESRRRHIEAKRAHAAEAVADLEDLGIPTGQAVRMIDSKRGGRAPVVSGEFVEASESAVDAKKVSTIALCPAGYEDDAHLEDGNWPTLEQAQS